MVIVWGHIRSLTLWVISEARLMCHKRRHTYKVCLDDRARGRCWMQTSKTTVRICASTVNECVLRIATVEPFTSLDVWYRLLELHFLGKYEASLTLLDEALCGGQLDRSDKWARQPETSFIIMAAAAAYSSLMISRCNFYEILTKTGSSIRMPWWTSELFHWLNFRSL